MWSVLLLVGFGIAGCSDDAPPFNSKHLTSGTGRWILTGKEIIFNGQTFEAYRSLEGCTKYNEFCYDNTGRYQLLAGPLKCGANYPDVLQTGTWKISSYSKNLTVQLATGGSISYEIIQLTATILKLRLIEEAGSAQKTIVTTYYKRLQFPFFN